MASFDMLPDTVAYLVLSKLEDATAVVRSSCVCRRWHQLAQWVDTLTFVSFNLFEKRMDQRRAQDLEAIVSAVLLKTRGVRHLSISYHPVVWPWVPNDHFSEEQVGAWLRHVAPSLERLTLVDPNRSVPQTQRLVQVSACRRLRWLNLCYGAIPLVSAACAPFESLTRLELDLVALTDAALVRLLSLCPLLEALWLNSCTGLESPHLRCKQLQSLQILNEIDGSDLGAIDCLTLCTPRLRQLTLVEVQALVVEDLGALVELDLRCHVQVAMRESLQCLATLSAGGDHWDLDSLVDLVRVCRQVKVLHAGLGMDGVLPLGLDWLLQHLPFVQDFDLGMDLFECLQLDASKQSTQQGCLPKLPHLRTCQVAVRRGDRSCTKVIAGLLYCAPGLLTLAVDTRRMEKHIQNDQFFSTMLALQRRYPRVQIDVTCPFLLI